MAKIKKKTEGIWVELESGKIIPIKQYTPEMARKEEKLLKNDEIKIERYINP